jgi:AraC-like DNA-binding protein
MAVFEAGQEHDALYEAGSVYVAVSLSVELLLAEADREGLALSLDALHSGVLDRPMEPGCVARLSAWFGALHRGEPARLPPGQRLEEAALAALLNHLAAGAEVLPMGFGPASFERIVERARDFIEGHVDDVLSIDRIAAAAHASRRTLNRAFLEILGETPRSYVLKLRLQRIRDELASANETELTVTMVSNRWGAPELGRLAARYREMFDELPSETLRRRNGAR